uniref:G-protein coupled receptors family 1 profile domain-containing protein n=1 Tax=Panagrolaimus sp. JU765 TaxID=591449 RepID=A0AC34QVH9_9BILA
MLCYIFPLFQGTSIFISTLTLMSIAVDRYFVICHHSLVNANLNDHLTMPVCLAIIAMIWTLSLSLVLPYAVHMRLAYIHEPCNYFMCIEDWSRNGLKSVFGSVVLFLQFILPFTVIIISYRNIWVFLNQRYRRQLRKYGDDESRKENKKRRRLLRMLMTMVFVFGICWLPVNILNLMRDTIGIIPMKRYFEFFFLFSHMISMMATAFNPLLYAWMNENFRKHFVDTIPCFGYFLNANQKRGTKKIIVTDATPARNRISCGDNVEGNQSFKRHKTSNLTVPSPVNDDRLTKNLPIRMAKSENTFDTLSPMNGNGIHHKTTSPPNVFPNVNFFYFFPRWFPKRNVNFLTPLKEK